MKDQYFGDVNDFRKYGLLRRLCGPAKLKLGVCWMLTMSDGTGDGEFRKYLREAKKYRRCDPELFDWLDAEVKELDDRRVERIENSGLLANAEFFSQELPEDFDKRKTYFDACADKFRGCDIVFFDPDNGIEVKSIAKGKPCSEKYVYWDELRAAFKHGASVLAYQHFRREPRDKFIDDAAQAMGGNLKALRVFSFRTPHVVFLLAAQPRHVNGFREAVQGIEMSWPATRAKGRPQFITKQH
jgi:hypothetical protein